MDAEFIRMLILLVVCIVFIIVSTAKFRLHPFLALLFASVGFGLLAKMPMAEIIDAISEGFGGTIGKIGIVIIAGTIIGTFLEHSGGAFSIAERILKVIGEKHVPLAMSVLGYIVSIPVFSDSAFIILSPLNKALSKRVKISLAGSALALAFGLSISHMLVPPTPGPIAAAGILDANLGMVILLGLPVGIFGLVVGWLYATKVAAKTYIDPEPDLTDEEIKEVTKQAPSASKSLLPILVPIVLIVAKSIADLEAAPMGSGFLRDLITFIGHPIIALLIGVLLAFTLPNKLKMEMLSVSGWVGQGVVKAAIIITVTAAGGAFGMVLRKSGIGDAIGAQLQQAHLGIWLPFFLCAAIRTAQGSGTVGIITSASIMAPLMGPLGFVTEPQKALVVLAIGSGGLIFSHANDSFFWVFTQVSGMDVKTGVKIWSVGTLVLGAALGVAVWIVSLFIL